MGQCQLDHTVEDVRNKYESQSEFLPTDIQALFTTFFLKNHSQQTLNEVFHLLKKYDLSNNDEKLARNVKLLHVLK